MSGRGARVAFWAGVVLILGAAALAYALLLGREPGTAPPLPPPPEEPAPAPLTVARASGPVELLRGGARVPLAAGETLRPDDAIVTGPGARVAVASGDSYSVELEGGARFDVGEITATLARFHLAAGLVSATVRDDPRRAVEIESGRGAVARTTGGDVSVSRSGPVVAVAVTRGAAELRAGGGAVRLEAGQRSLVADGERPAAAAPIPRALLLKVNWPAEARTNRPRLVVTGRTEPGAVLVVAGAPVEVGPDGTFTQVVYLREGRQRLGAEVRAVGARTARADGAAIVLDTRAPDARFDTRGLWGGKQR